MSKFTPYPIHSRTHSIGARAIAIVHYQLDCDKWVFRQKTGDDYGVDCELEYVENNLLRGKKIECQVKGTANIGSKFLKRSPHFATFDIPVKTINYGLRCRNPFVLFVVDIVSERVYFAGVKTSFPNAEYVEAAKQDSTKRVHFDTKRTLLDDAFLLERVFRQLH